VPYARHSPRQAARKDANADINRKPPFATPPREDHQAPSVRLNRRRNCGPNMMSVPIP
jgi:hypothetical protein